MLVIVVSFNLVTHSLMICIDVLTFHPFGRVLRVSYHLGSLQSLFRFVVDSMWILFEITTSFESWNS